MTRPTDDDFFHNKRAWSQIKDRVLGTYLVPYLPKVAQLRKQIVLVDGFGGPGRYDDGSIGSPLIIARAAERLVPGHYKAYFVNANRDHHEKLTRLMQPLIDAGRVVTVHGTAADLLQRMAGVLKDQTLFLYLDPFGLAGCEFSLIRPFLERPRSASTEVLINVQTQTIHRTAAMTAAAKGVTYQVDALQRRLTAVLGGNYWRSILSDASLSADQKAEKVVEEYRRLLNAYLPFTGACPVRERPGAAVKYRMVFCSRHPDAPELMNDAMCTAYNERMHEALVTDTLFENTSWDDDRRTDGLATEVIAQLRRCGPVSRRRLWLTIIQANFMQFLTREYRAVIKQHVDAGAIKWIDVRGTRRLNDDSVLYLPDDPPRLSFQPASAPGRSARSATSPARR